MEEMNLTFEQRKKMEDKFVLWAARNNAKICPFNVIAYLDANGLIKTEEFIEFLDKDDEE